VIGVLATVGTLKSAQFAALLESYGRNVKVITQGCVGLVECIERGELESTETKALIRQYTSPYWSRAQIPLCWAVRIIHL